MTSSSNDPRYGLSIGLEWAKYQLGALSAIQLEDISLALLDQHPGDPELATVASFGPRTPEATVREAFDQVGVTRGLPFLADPDRRLDLGIAIVEAIATKQISEQEGSRLISDLVRARGARIEIEVPEILEIAAYSGLWDEFPDQAAVIEEKVRIAASSLFGSMQD